MTKKLQKPILDNKEDKPTALDLMIEKNIVLNYFKSTFADLTSNPEQLKKDTTPLIASQQEAIDIFLTLPYDPKKSAILTQKQGNENQAKEDEDKLSQEVREIYISKFMPIETRIEYLQHILSPARFDQLKGELQAKKHYKDAKEEAIYEAIYEAILEKEKSLEEHKREGHGRNSDDINILCKAFNHEKDDHIEFLGKLSKDTKNIRPLLLLINKFKETVVNKDHSQKKLDNSQTKLDNSQTNTYPNKDSNTFITSLMNKYNNSTGLEKENLMLKINVMQRQLMDKYMQSRITEHNIAHMAQLIDDPKLLHGLASCVHQNQPNKKSSFPKQVPPSKTFEFKK